MPLNINQVQQPQGGSRELLEAGPQMARLVQIIDLGLQKQKPFKGKEKRPAFQVQLTFEFPNDTIEVDGEEKPKWKSRRVNLSTHEKSTCARWMRVLDPKGESKGDLTKLIGTPCLALIVHEAGTGPYEGQTFDKVEDLMPLMKGQEVPELQNDPRVFDLTSPDMDVFNGLPDFLQNIIKENLEYDGSKLQNLVEGNPVKYTARAEGDAPQDQDAEQVSVEQTAAHDPSEGIDDDDEPF